MELEGLRQTLQQDAVTVVFANVLLQQIGLPVPVVPTLLLAGSLALGPQQFALLLAAAVAASVLADWIWYLAGKAFGYRVLAGLCRLSINPASCVSQTESRFLRWGVSSLIFAKFVPGFSTVAPPIAGAMRMPPLGFLLAAGCGAALWAGLALAGGWLLRDAVAETIPLLEAHAGNAALLALALVFGWIVWKFWQKYRFRQLAAIPHITPDELIAALAAEQPPLLIDLRGSTMIAATGPILGAVAAEHDRLHEAVAGWPKERPIVTLCACPEDAGAIQAARRLLDAGFHSVRPLGGGYDAWLAATGTAPTAD